LPALADVRVALGVAQNGAASERGRR
jgi:hypothetical protein